MSDAQLQLVLKAIDQTKPGFDSASRNADRAGKAFATMGKLAAGALGFGAAGLAGGLAVAVKAAAGFEQSLADVKAATGATAQSMKLMRDEALKIGKDTSKSASEAVAAMGELTKSGVSVEAAVGGVARTVVNLSEATGASVADMATLMADSLNVFKLGAGESSDAANILAKAAGASSIDISDMAQSLAAGGLVAAQAGLSINDFATAIGIMGNQGLKASDAGTSLKSFIAALTPNSKEAAAAMREMGFSAFTATGQFKDMPALIGDLQKAFGGMTPEMRAAKAELIFGADGVRALNALLSEGVPGWTNFTAAMAGAPSIAEQSATKLNTLQGRIETLKGTLETMAINIGSMVLPTLVNFADWASKGLDTLMTRDWSGVVQNIKAIGTAFETVRDAAMPVIAGIFHEVERRTSAAILFFQIHWPEIETAAQKVADSIKSIWGLMNDDMLTGTENNSGAISKLIDNMGGIIGNTILTIVRLINQDWSGAWLSLQNVTVHMGNILESVIRGIRDVVNDSGDAVVRLNDKFKAWLGRETLDALKKVQDGVMWFLDPFSGIADAIDGAIEAVKRLGQAAREHLSSIEVPGWMKALLRGSDPPIVEGTKMAIKAVDDLGDSVDKLGQKLAPLLSAATTIAQAAAALTGRAQSAISQGGDLPGAPLFNPADRVEMAKRGKEAGKRGGPSQTAEDVFAAAASGTWVSDYLKKNFGISLGGSGGLVGGIAGIGEAMGAMAAAAGITAGAEAVFGGFPGTDPFAQTKPLSAEALAGVQGDPVALTAISSAFLGSMGLSGIGSGAMIRDVEFGRYSGGAVSPAVAMAVAGQQSAMKQRAEELAAAYAMGAAEFEENVAQALKNRIKKGGFGGLSFGGSFVPA